jgi:hypothetical protein
MDRGSAKINQATVEPERDRLNLDVSWLGDAGRDDVDGPLPLCRFTWFSGYGPDRRCACGEERNPGTARNGV